MYIFILNLVQIIYVKMQRRYPCEGFEGEDHGLTSGWRANIRATAEPTRN